jgi:hypothetical protein
MMSGLSWASSHLPVTMHRHSNDGKRFALISRSPRDLSERLVSGAAPSFRNGESVQCQQCPPMTAKSPRQGGTECPVPGSPDFWAKRGILAFAGPRVLHRTGTGHRNRFFHSERPKSPHVFSDNQDGCRHPDCRATLTRQVQRRALLSGRGHRDNCLNIQRTLQEMIHGQPGQFPFVLHGPLERSASDVLTFRPQPRQESRRRRGPPLRPVACAGCGCWSRRIPGTDGVLPCRTPPEL